LTQEPRRRLNVLSKDLFLSLYLPAFALALGEGMMAPVLPIYAKSFEVSFEVATLVIIIQGVGGLVATFPTGMLVDRIGRRPVLLAGPIITAASSFLTALAPSFAFLLACRFFAGGASQMWQLSRLAMIADTGADRERGRLITWMMEMSRIAGLISPVVGGFTAALWDIRIPFVLHGILVLVAIIPSFRITKETDPNRGPGRTAPEPIPGGPWRYVLSQMRQPQIAAFMLAQFLATFCRGLNRGGLLNLYAAYTYGVGPATLGVLASANSFIGLPIGFSTGYIMDRWGRKRTIVPGFSLLFIALLFMASTALFQMPFEIFVVAYFAVHLSQGITGGNMQVMGSDLAPKRARGQFISAWRLIANLGSEASAPSFALIGAAFGYAASMATMAFGSLGVALVVGLLIRETVGRARDGDELVSASSRSA
jgi:MFS family permease